MNLSLVVKAYLHATSAKNDLSDTYPSPNETFCLNVTGRFFSGLVVRLYPALTASTLIGLTSTPALNICDRPYSDFICLFSFSA